MRVSVRALRRLRRRYDIEVRDEGLEVQEFEGLGYEKGGLGHRVLGFRDVGSGGDGFGDRGLGSRPMFIVNPLLKGSGPSDFLERPRAEGLGEAPLPRLSAENWQTGRTTHLKGGLNNLKRGFGVCHSRSMVRNPKE